MRKVIVSLFLCLLLIVGCSNAPIKSESKLDRPNIKLLENVPFTYEGPVDPAVAIKWDIVKDEEYYDPLEGLYYIRTTNPDQNAEVKFVVFCFVVMPVVGEEVSYKNMFLKWYFYTADGRYDYYGVDKEGNYKLMEF